MEFLRQFGKATFQTFGDVPWGGVYVATKYALILLSVLLLVGIISIIPKAWSFQPKFYPKKKRREEVLTWKGGEYKARWNTIIEKSETAPPQSLILAIIEADSFIDTILKDLNLKGEHMADRLEQLDLTQINTLDNIWRAHRLRNQLVHTPGYSVNQVDAQRFLKYYEDFLKEIGVL